MTIPFEQLDKIINENSNKEMRNRFAQGQAKRLLLEVGDAKENFPNFSLGLDDDTTTTAYALLGASLSLYEQQFDATQQNDIHRIIEFAAQGISNAHINQINQDANSNFHMLTAAMGFYVSAQYSKAFIAIKNANTEQPICNMLYFFLKRDRESLIKILGEVLVSPRPSVKCTSEAVEPAITISIAKALANLLEYQISGDDKYYQQAVFAVDTGKDIAVNLEAPLLWWILRLLKAMIVDYKKHSLWELLSPHFSHSSELLRKYIQTLAFSTPAVTELWKSQAAAVDQIFNRENSGIVINMRTSAGKTRIAELAVLHTLSIGQTAKILYLAPYRSLAIEIEHSLANIFEVLGFKISFLYGGFRISNSDINIANESTITIATPEKAKAMFRASPELLSSYKLVIIDEGHLLGDNERLIRNEIFFEHLRAQIKHNNGRILLLSAVLPNPEDLAQWIGDISNGLVRSSWKPADERTGYLKWTGTQVDLEWDTQYPTSNKAFVKQRTTPKYPKDKNEAIAATAIKLSAIGPIMIFCGQARSVRTMAGAVLKGINNINIHPWPEKLWNIYKNIAEEEIGKDSIEAKAAEKGIICHSNKLPSQLRMITERLMRCAVKPRIIIATSTLAQGVNIGISAVIISSLLQDRGQYVDHRDFWNICGRAGRAFVDFEGKILFSIDMTKDAKKVKASIWHAKNYFDRRKSDPVISGLLHSIAKLYDIARAESIDNSMFLSMIAENDFSSISSEENRNAIENIFNLIDDTLIAIEDDENYRVDDEDSIDRVFRSSLSAIQVNRCDMKIDDITSLLKNRSVALKHEAPEVEKRRIFIASGLPYNNAKKMYDHHHELLKAIEDHSSYAEILEWFEEWIRIIFNDFAQAWPKKEQFDKIRQGWITGIPISVLTINDSDREAITIIKTIYGYDLPWFLHASAQVLLNNGYEEHAEIMENLSGMVEFGLPNSQAILIFQSGIRSRHASCELSNLKYDWCNSLKKIKDQILFDRELKELITQVSPDTQNWISYIAESIQTNVSIVDNFNSFSLSEASDYNKLYVRNLNGKPYLCSVDGAWKGLYQSTKEFPWENISDDLRYAFIKQGEYYIFENRDHHTR